MDNKVTLAVIDDEPSVLNALTLLLRALGYDVKSFGSPVDALSALSEPNEVHAILCDLRMPQIDGLEFLKRLNANGAHAPFILMSGHGGDNEFSVATKLGAAAFLRKPFTPAELTSTIQGAIVIG